MIPITRKEVFYNAILNGGDTPTPVTREEMYLAEIAKNGSGGGGGGGGVTVVECTYNSGAHTITSTATASELLEACLNGWVIMSYTDDESYDVSLLNYLFINVILMAEDYTSYVFGTALGTFRADAATDYPVMTLE